MPFPPKLLTRRGRPPYDDVLTPAEWAIVHAVRHGLSDARIAVRRGVSRDAVKYHVRNVLAKLGLQRRAELRRWAGVPKDSAAHLVHRHADGTEEWMAFFNDPEGRVLALMSQVRPASRSAPPETS